MYFQNIHDFEAALASPSLSVRDLYVAWKRRQPVPDFPTKKKYPVREGAETGQIAWVQDNPALSLQFTNRALEKEEFLLVCDAAGEALRYWTSENEQERVSLVRIRMNYATALTRLGCTRDARQQLESCLRSDSDAMMDEKLKAEIFLQLGDVLSEESHHASSRAAMLHSANEAVESYKRSLQLHPDRLETLSRTAAALLILGEPGSTVRGDAEETARHILELTGKLEDVSGATVATALARATAHAVLGNVETAAQSYGQLSTMEGVATKDLAEARYNARFLAEALGMPRDFFKPAFPPLQLIVFAGAMPDRAGVAPGRAPYAIEATRVSIRAKLRQLDARVGLVSAAAGAQLLFFDAMQERHATVHLILPWSRGEFRQACVDPFDSPGAPPVWAPLYDRAIEEAATVREIGQIHASSTEIGWHYLLEVSAGLALGIARIQRLDVQPMGLWHGQAVEGTTNSASFAEFWRQQLHIEPIRIELPSGSRAAATDIIIKPHTRCEQPTLHQEVKSMLFADIVGYSKLTEQVIPEFVESFLVRLSELAATSRHAPRSLDSWGDAIYATFDYARDAGCFAIEMTKMIHEGEKDWLEKGLYWEQPAGDSRLPMRFPLNIRIGLHTGPVFMHYCPISRRLGFTGAHVTRAARIEPVARPGEIFASEEFAALSELGAELDRRASGAAREPSERFVCEYAGSIQLAKSYPGRHRLYRVLQKRNFAIEDLARAAHEYYCATATARGENPAMNNALRAWEALPEDLRDANRDQVADIPQKLQFLGWELAPSYGTHASEISMTDAQIETLAIREHQRWFKDRERHGWTYGQQRDNSRKQHPLLIPWDQLPENEKEKDRDAVRNVPCLLERAGFRVRKAANGTRGGTIRS